MKSRKMVVGLAVSLPAIIGKSGVKLEIINSLARQIGNLGINECDVWVYVFQSSEYLKIADWESEIAQTFSKAFGKRKLATNFLKRGSNAIGSDIEKTFQNAAISIVMGCKNFDNFKEGNIFDSTADDAYFAFLCRETRCDLAVYIGGYFDCRRRKKSYQTLISDCPHTISFHYAPEFFSKSVAQKLEDYHEVSPVIVTKKRTIGVRYAFS